MQPNGNVIVDTICRTAAGPRGLVRADEAWRRQEQAMARTNQAAALATGTPVVKVFETAVAPKQYAR